MLRGTSPHAWGKLRRIFPESLRLSVHPPTRGENCHRVQMLEPQGGTSPHAWGKRSTARQSAAMFAVHPHTRGENGIALLIFGRLVRYIPTRVGKTQQATPVCSLDTGTSPHAWGKRRGSTSSSGINPVHPHTRGENGSSALIAEPCCGTSPHAWGKLARAAGSPRCQRYIPTRVGKTRLG